MPGEQGLFPPCLTAGFLQGLKRKKLLVRSLGGRSGLSAEVQKALESQCTLFLPYSLPTPCFPSMKTVNLFYFHQS